MPSDIKIVGEFEIKNKSKEIEALQKEISKLEKKQLPLIGQFEELQQKIAQTKKAIADADKALAAGKIDKVDHFQISQEATRSVEQYTQKLEDLRSKIEVLDNQIQPMQSQLESLKFTGSADNSMTEVAAKAKENLESAAKAAGNMSSQLGQAKAQADNLGKSVGKVDSEAGKSSSGIKGRFTSALKSVESAFGSFGKRISSTIKSAFIFSVLYKGLNELKARISAMLSTNQQFTSSLNQVKSNLAVAFQPIYQVAMPAINALMQLLVRATAYIAAFVNALFGTSLGKSIQGAREMENSIKAVQSGASGASAAEKQLTAAIKEKQNQVKALQRENKSLQREYQQQKKAVDAQTEALESQISAIEKEISALQKAEQAANAAAQAQREMIQANIDALQEKIEENNKASQAAQKSIDSQIKSMQSQQKSLDNQYKSETKAIDNRIKALQNEIKAIQKAQKAAQAAAKANQKFSADFDELSTLGTIEETDPYDAEIEKIQEKIEVLQEEKEVVSEAYEQRKEAIQNTIDAYQEQKSAIADSYDAQNEKIQEQIDALQKAQDAIKGADYSASISGYESKIDKIREKIDELNNSLEENPQIEQNELLIEKLQEEIDLLQEQKDAIQEVNGAASSFTDSGMEEEINGINKKIIEFIQVAGGIAAIGGIIAGVIIAVKNFGAIWTALTGFLTSGIGIFALVVTAISAIVVAAGNGQEMINNLKYTFEGLGKFIKGVFAGDLETAKEGIIQMLRGLCNVFAIILESIVNLIIRGINWVIEKLNSIDYTVPDWVPGIGGERIHPNISPVNEWSAPRYAIPALATGAVLPPNKPFMAWVGDQKHGTNIEAPLSTIEEALRNVMAEQQYNFNITADGSMGALIRMLNLHISREDSRKTAF